MSQIQSAGLIWRDKFRELMFPAVVLAIVGTLWIVGYAEDRQEIADRPLPPLPVPSAQVSGHASSGHVHSTSFELQIEPRG